eukprot:TRINITY_DN2771_c0_g2_i1.p1 TRINITY_DN2771_c0_g2~~TRINITY_DN2771_c0_g2_i1.p1  ORF type:complete len:214 (+),score=84.05 TRINITY_DN2771_c0_g2_i1:82-642(+)
MAGGVKGFFWSGIITINDRLEHAFFDVKSKKKTIDGTPSVFLTTQDLPPVPIIGPSTKLHVRFFLENHIGASPVRHKVVETTIELSDTDLSSLKASADSHVEKIDGTDWHLHRVKVPHDPEPVSGSSSSSSSSSSAAPIKAFLIKTKKSVIGVPNEDGEVGEWNPWHLKEITVRLSEKTALTFFQY